jgi:hypothetical protein
LTTARHRTSHALNTSSNSASLTCDTLRPSSDTIDCSSTSSNRASNTSNTANQATKKLITVFGIQRISDSGFHRVHDIHFFLGEFVFKTFFETLLKFLFT